MGIKSWVTKRLIQSALDESEKVNVRDEHGRKYGIVTEVRWENEGLTVYFGDDPSAIQPESAHTDHVHFHWKRP